MGAFHSWEEWSTFGTEEVDMKRIIFAGMAAVLTIGGLMLVPAAADAADHHETWQHARRDHERHERERREWHDGGVQWRYGWHYDWRYGYPPYVTRPCYVCPR